MEEKTDYLVGTKTMGLREANHPEYATIIYDTRGIYSSRKTSLQLLNEACILIGGADYQGKIKAIQYKFGYSKKTPLIICLLETVYAFPTKSPTHYDCRWVFPGHVKDIVWENGRYYSAFKNGLKMEINCSLHTYKEQEKRASHCYLRNIHCFSHLNKTYTEQLIHKYR